MNIIKEQRETIIKENNTAQEKLRLILDKLNKNINTLDINIPLQGDINFSILKEEDFTHIKTILIEKGEITNIAGIPDGVTKIVIQQNLLFNLSELPSSLTHLEIPHNYLSELNLIELKELQYLNISHNQFEEIENLPKSLVELHCQNNHFKLLDFQGLENLKTLNISSNKITVIENLPENIVDFNYENNPSIEFRNSPSIPKEKQPEDEMDIKQQVTYNEALARYFQLKHQYESSIFAKKKEMYKMSTKPKKIKMQELKSLKPACINCRRPVGTIFKRKDERHLVICGDAKQPCHLKIELYTGRFSDNETLMYDFKEHVEDLKDKIIQQKLDTLFNFVNEKTAVEEFKKELNNYNETNIMLKELTDKYNDNYHNLQKNELIHKKREVIYRYIENVRSLLKEYENSENRELLKTAVQLQVEKLFPETENLRRLMSEHMEMTTDKEYINHYLFKNQVALSKNDFTFGEPQRVIHFRMN
jgi:hypothetical protein